MSFDNLIGYILSIPMCMQNFITIFHSVQDIWPVSLFQNLELSKTSTNEIWHFTISWARSCWYQVYQNISLSSGDKAIFTFQNLVLGKASTDDKCHFAIVSLFKEFEPRQKLNQYKCHLTISWGTSCQYQCVCKISSHYSTQFKR